MTFEHLTDFKQNHCGRFEILQKLLLLKVFLNGDIKTRSYFFVAVLFKIFMKQTLTNDFLGLHKSMNELRVPFKKKLILHHEMVCINCQLYIFWTTLKPLLARWKITEERKLLNIFGYLKRDLYLVSGPFCFS